MDMAISQCWDCPVPFLQAVFRAAVALFALGLAVRLSSARVFPIRLLGFVGTAFALLGYLLVGASFFKWGVAWHEGGWSARTAQLAVVIPWCLSTGFLLFWLQQRCRRRNAAALVSGV